MYQIMTVSKDNASMYQFYKVKDKNGNYVIWSADTEAELEEQVENMLNGDFAKKDFIIIEPYEYGVETTINSSILSIGGY